jgi:hypothetical protein
MGILCHCASKTLKSFNSQYPCCLLCAIEELLFSDYEFNIGKMF